MTKKSIIKLDSARLSGEPLPQSTKEFVAVSGLRTPRRLGVAFEAQNGGFPTLTQYCQDKRLPLPRDGERYYRIGASCGTELCLTIPNGCVICIDPSGELITRYINATLELFVKFLDVYDRYCEVGPTIPESEDDQFTDSIVLEMRRLDPSAFDDRENWWATIVEEIESGMA